MRRLTCQECRARSCAWCHPKTQVRRSLTQELRRAALSPRTRQKQHPDLQGRQELRGVPRQAGPVPSDPGEAPPQGPFPWAVARRLPDETWSFPFSMSAGRLISVRALGTIGHEPIEIRLAYALVPGRRQQRTAVRGAGSRLPGPAASALRIGLGRRPPVAVGQLAACGHAVPRVRQHHRPLRYRLSGPHLRIVRVLSELPHPSRAGEDGGQPAVADRRPLRVRHRCRMGRARVPRLRLRVPEAGRAHRPVGRGRADRQKALDRSARHLPRHLLPGHRRLLRAAAGPRTATADRRWR